MNADTRTPGRDGTWIKASRSSNGLQCVEMRRQGPAVQVRDSKHPHGPVLTFAPGEFAAWLTGAARGEFTGLIGG